MEFVVIAIILVILFFVYKNKKEKLSKMTEEEKEKYYEEKKEKTKQKLQAIKEKLKNDMEKQKNDSEIDYTIMVTSEDQKSMASSIVRGAVGGFALGGIGALGGLASGKTKHSTVFTIVYKSGRREVKKVKNNSKEFKKLAKYVR